MTEEVEERFPPYLLKRSTAERYEYFESYSTAHPVLDNAFNRLVQIILLPASIQLVFVIGPPGAGKTFLREWVEDEFRDLWAKQQDADPGRIPVVGIEVPSKDRVRPSAGDIYKRILIALEEPLIDKKVTYREVTLRGGADGSVRIDQREKTDNLRLALEAALKNRRPYFLFLDEAQHLFNVAGLSMEEIMDWLKSIANTTGVLMVLLGTYEMLSLLDLSDQLMRRSRIIHLRRYTDGEDDILCFRSTVAAFQRQMPFPVEPDLSENWEYLHERTAGCIGNLYDWLLQAVNAALQKGADTLTLNHLKSCVPMSTKRAKKMHDSIGADEHEFMEEIGEDDAENVEVVRRKKRRTKEAGGGETDGRKAKRKGSKVGHRKPGRDKTGGRRRAGNV